MEADLGVNPNGSFKEIVGTSPDVELLPARPPASFTKEGLLEDEWIQWVLADPPGRADGDSER
jgi:hypothetical protein